ncbi:MAG: acyl-CoA dehydrogenase family protein [Dehalococcoidia bacterium]
MNATEFVAPVAPEIGAAATRIEQEGRLPATLIASLKARGLFSLYTPRQFGGLELPLPDALRIIEEVSRCDGSTGWTVALGVVNGYLMSSLPDAGAQAVFRDGPTLIAGAFGPGVRAVQVEGGYRLTGRWAFNSGAWNADWMSVGASVFDGEAPKMGPQGPEMAFVVIPPSDVTVLDTWDAVGLRGTNSHDLVVDDVFVPDQFVGRIALPQGPVAVRESCLTRFSMFTLLGLAQSPPVCLGIARRATDEFREIALTKERPFTGRLCDQVQTQVGLARAESLLQSARTFWFASVEAAWDKVACGGDLEPADRATLRMASLTAVENSVAAVDLLYRLAGSTAISNGTAFDRCWRDIHTAASHLQVQDSRWETAGRVLFGLEPNNPLL